MESFIYRTRDIPWIWGEVLKPQYRFAVSPPDCPDDGHMYSLIDSWVLWVLLHNLYEQEIRRELVDPEWPCPYWEEQEELREVAA